MFTRRMGRFIAAHLAVGTAAAFTVLTSSAIGSTAVPAPYPGASTNAFSDATAPIAPNAPVFSAGETNDTCLFNPEGDYVHTSGLTASGHGWWDNINCDSPTATVTIRLQEYFSNGTWQFKGDTGTDTVYSGGGSANRVTSKANCGLSFNQAGWRSQIHVDVTGIPTLPNEYYTQSQNIDCTA